MKPVKVVFDIQSPLFFLLSSSRLTPGRIYRAIMSNCLKCTISPLTSYNCSISAHFTASDPTVYQARQDGPTFSVTSNCGIWKQLLRLALGGTCLLIGKKLQLHETNRTTTQIKVRTSVDWTTIIYNIIY